MNYVAKARRWIRRNTASISVPKERGCVVPLRCWVSEVIFTVIELKTKLYMSFSSVFQTLRVKGVWARGWQESRPEYVPQDGNILLETILLKGVESVGNSKGFGKTGTSYFAWDCYLKTKHCTTHLIIISAFVLRDACRVRQLGVVCGGLMHVT